MLFSRMDTTSLYCSAPDTLEHFLTLRTEALRNEDSQ
mgnify:CR=1 FL=1